MTNKNLIEVETLKTKDQYFEERYCVICKGPIPDQKNRKYSCSKHCANIYRMLSRRINKGEINE